MRNIAIQSARLSRSSASSAPSPIPNEPQTGARSAHRVRPASSSKVVATLAWARKYPALANAITTSASAGSSANASPKARIRQAAGGRQSRVAVRPTVLRAAGPSAERGREDGSPSAQSCVSGITAAIARVKLPAPARPNMRTMTTVVAKPLASWSSRPASR
jgi:hypothetical protein